MRHPTEGVLRRLLDEPAGVADPDREHVAGCAPCLAGLAAACEDAGHLAAALEPEGEGDVDLAAGWHRLSTAMSAGGPGRTTALAAVLRSEDGSRAGRARAVLRRPATAALAVAVVLTGAGTAAAHGWLQIFRPEQIAPVSLGTEDLVALPDLSAYGDVVLDGDPDVRQVPDASTAAEQTGLDVPEVTTLPRGVQGDPVYQVGDRASATFTFSAERAVQAAEEAGTALPSPPPRLDGSSVRLVAGPGVAQVWASAAGVPALVVGRAVAPSTFSSGAPFETVRDYLLSLPGLPEQVAAQLRTFTADGSTLPLPVPADEVTTSRTEVDGAPATVLATRDRTLAAVVWVDGGTVTVVAGSSDTDEVLAVAEDLQ